MDGPAPHATVAPASVRTRRRFLSTGSETTRIRSDT
jgi:hypothetical protein